MLNQSQSQTNADLDQDQKGEILHKRRGFESFGLLNVGAAGGRWPVADWHSMTLLCSGMAQWHWLGLAETQKFYDS